MTTAIADFRVAPLSDALGAEISGLDLSRPLDAAAARRIEEAWHEHLVLLFRGQDLSNEAQVRFCRRFGALERVRTGKEASAAMPYTMMITNVTDTGLATALENGEMWFHSDQCYYEVPAKASTLYAIEVPPEGGNTLFANCYKAWETLAPGIRRKLAPLRARHVYDYAGNPLVGGGDVDPDAPRWSHPVARTHPATGRKALYVNRLMTDRIEGLPEDESDAMLEMLFAHSEQPAFVYEHVWRPGDLLMWDNRCSMHARTDFDPSHRRMLRRITIKGEAVA